MIKSGKERTNEEIMDGLHEMQGNALMSVRYIAILGDAAERIDRQERKIEDLEERIDILMAELMDDGKKYSGLIEEE